MRRENFLKEKRCPASVAGRKAAPARAFYKIKKLKIFFIAAICMCTAAFTGKTMAQTSGTTGTLNWVLTGTSPNYTFNGGSFNLCNNSG